MTKTIKGSRRTLPYIEDEYWDSFNAIRKKYNLSWNDVFKRFHMYQNGIEYIFSAPGELTKQLKLDLNTVMGLITKWISNIRDNWFAISENPDVSRLKSYKSFKGRPAIIVGAGHSLRINKHLDILRDYIDNYGDVMVFSTAHMLKDCLDAGVIPLVTGIVDADEIMLNFIDHDIVKDYMPEIFMVMCVSAHPKVVKTWRDAKYFFRSGIPQNLIPNVDTFLTILLPQTTELDTGGNSGAFMYSLATYLECNPIAMIGMDLGYPKDYPYEKTQYFNAYAMSIGKEYKDKQDMIEKCYTDFHHPIFKTDYYYDFVYEVFQNSLKEMIRYNKQLNKNHRVINCSEGGCIYSEDIECMPLKKFLYEVIR